MLPLRGRPDTSPPSLRPSDDAGHRELLRFLKDEIRRQGPLPFSRFQELCLYHPRHGYYSRGAAIGREGADYWTAPEMDPVFGELIGVQIAEMAGQLGQPDDFRVVEYGAGTGSLAAGLLASWRGAGSPLYRQAVYRIVETSTVLRARQQRCLATHGSTVVWTDASDKSAVKHRGRSGAGPGVVLMNEVIDALPVDRVLCTSQGIREIRVGLEAGDNLVEVLVPVGRELQAEISRRLPPARKELAIGQEIEVRLAMQPFVRRAASQITAGYLLVIDYGARADDLYHPRRLHGTTLAYHRHHASAGLLQRVGQQDLTAHVDFSALQACAQEVGFQEAGFTSQMRFLLALGLGSRLEALDRAAIPSREAIARRMALTALIRPGGMGEMFRVWIGARQAALRLRGLQDPFAESQEDPSAPPGASP